MKNKERTRDTGIHRQSHTIGSHTTAPSFTSSEGNKGNKQRVIIFCFQRQCSNWTDWEKTGWIIKLKENRLIFKFIIKKREETSDNKTITCSLCGSVCTAPVYHWRKKKSWSSFCLFYASFRFEEEKKKCWLNSCLQRSRRPPPPPPLWRRVWEKRQIRPQVGSEVRGQELSPRWPGPARRWGGCAQL